MSIRSPSLVDIFLRLWYNFGVKLAFFDIECAGVHKNIAKICVFGYVLCDENFNILEKEDLLINPRGKFELTDRKGEKGIKLPYDYAEFKRHPAFPAVYPRIKSLLEDGDCYVIGHAVLNDVKYLNLESRRFRLPSFCFRFTDSQLLYMSHKKDFSRQYGLEHIAEDLGVEFTPHRAVDDAYATMRVVQALCNEYNCSFSSLIKTLGVKPGTIANYGITRPQSSGMKAYNAECTAKKQARSRARIKFFDNLSRKRIKRGGLMGGKTFTFSRMVEDVVETSVPLVDRIYELGGKYSTHIEECDYYVKGEADDTVRTANAVSMGNIKILGLADLKELLNV